MSKSNRNHHQEEEPENTERWLLTYSDLITLLLIFFILMYTMAKLDVAKFNTMKDALAGALKSGTSSIQQGSPGILDKEQASQETSTGEGNEQVQMDAIEEKVIELVNKYNLQNYIVVTQEERGLDIEIRNELSNIVLFNSGSADLTPPAGEIISRIGSLLKELPNNLIRVEGHTDNRPINTVEFDSNWELSTARSTNVVKLLVRDSGLAPTKLSAVGYGEYKPVSSNDTEEGRAKNRRVNIVIIRSKYNMLETGSN